MCRKSIVVWVCISGGNLFSIAYLTVEDESLQELAANSDKLIATLVECLDDRPNEDEDLVQERHFEMFDTLCEVCTPA